MKTGASGYLWRFLRRFRSPGAQAGLRASCAGGLRVDTTGPAGAEVPGPTTISTSRALTLSDIRARFEEEVAAQYGEDHSLDLSWSAFAYALPPGGSHLEPVQVFRFSVRLPSGIVDRVRQWAYRVDDPQAPRFELGF